jgi:hypothetical protein
MADSWSRHAPGLATWTWQARPRPDFDEPRRCPSASPCMPQRRQPRWHLSPARCTATCGTVEDSTYAQWHYSRFSPGRVNPDHVQLNRVPMLWCWPDDHDFLAEQVQTVQIRPRRQGLIAFSFPLFFCHELEFMPNWPDRSALTELSEDQQGRGAPLPMKFYEEWSIGLSNEIKKHCLDGLF